LPTHFVEPVLYIVYVHVYICEYEYERIGSIEFFKSILKNESVCICVYVDVNINKRGICGAY
jgi:hypothetical protein